MLLTPLTAETLQIIGKIAEADVVRVDDELYVITKKSKQLDEMARRVSKIEDHEVVFETDYHRFTWWEITNELAKINEAEWKLGENIVSFHTIQPI